MNFQTMNRQRKYILIAAAVGIITMFLPWVTISVSLLGYSESRSTNGFHNYGIAAFIGFAVVAVLSFVGEQTKPLEKTFWLAALAAGAITLLFSIIAVANVSNVLDGGLGLANSSVGFGAWIALVAAAAVLASAWLFKNPTHDLKSSFDEVKKSFSVAVPVQNNTGVASSVNNKIAELERLSKLKETGSISEEEYQQLKSKVL